MVLNPRTLHVSPQYHVVFDDNFSTVQSMVHGEVPDKWTTLVQQSDEHRDEAGNDFTHLWASQEFDPFHDEDHMEELPTSEFESTSQNELLIPTMPDLDELTCRRSKRERRAPDRFDPSASTTTIEKDLSTTKTSVMFSMLSLVTNGFNEIQPTCSSIHSKIVYHTQLINQHFDGTLNHILPTAYASNMSDNESYTCKQML